jgi:hypothetical protein
VAEFTSPAIETIEGASFKAFIMSGLVRFEDALNTSIPHSASSAFADEGHAHCRRRMEIAGSAFELRVLIGIHPGVLGSDDEQERVGYFHFDIELRPSRLEFEDESSNSWARLNSWLCAHGLQVSVSSTLRATVPGSFQLPVKLPIPLNETDTRGFSSIRGVRLAQQDEADKNRELYSIVLDTSGTLTSVTAAVSVDTKYGPELLSDAFAAAADVVRLALAPQR